MVTRVICVLDDFISSAFAAFEVDVLILGITIPHWDALSQYTFYVPWIESFQDSWWDPEFPQLLQMVQSLPGFLDLCLNVCGPCQVLGAVYTEVLEAAHPLHRGPTDHKRSLGPLLSLPEVHDQLFSFAHIQRETVVLAPWWKVSISSKYAVLSLLEMRPRTTVLWLNILFYSVLFTMQSSVKPNFWFIYPSFAKFSDISEVYLSSQNTAKVACILVIKDNQCVVHSVCECYLH